MAANENKKDPTALLCSDDFARTRFYGLRFPLRVRRDDFVMHTQKNHFHDFPQLWYCYSGKYEHIIDGVKYPCEEKSVIIVPPGAVHSFEVKEPSVLFSLNLSPEIFLSADYNRVPELFAFMMMARFRDEISDAVAVKTVTLSESSSIAFDRLLSDVTLTSELRESSLDDIVTILNGIFLLPEFHSEDLDRESLLQIIEKTVLPIIRVQRYINENFSRKITTEQLLRESLFCQTAFFKAFKRVFGIRASYYIQRLRTVMAIFYLAHTAYDINQISDFCGFNSPSHLVMCHKKHTGKKPKYLRTKLKEYFDDHPESKKNPTVLNDI